MFKQLFISSRAGNLLIIGLALSFAMQKSLVIFPLLTYICIVLSTVLVASAGYLINDYYDQEIDKINKPNKNIFRFKFIQKHFTKLYLGLNAVAILFSFWYSWKLVIIDVLCIGILFAYSKWWKKSFLIGNISMAIMQAIIFALPLILFYNYFDKFAQYFLMVLGGFAFVFSWLREWVKDIEDRVGDEAAGGKTVAIRWSIQQNKNGLIFLASLGVIILVAFTSLLWSDSFYTSEGVLTYFFSFLITPVAIRSIYMIYKSEEPADWAKLSGWIKLIMLLGVLSLKIV